MQEALTDAAGKYFKIIDEIQPHLDEPQKTILMLRLLEKASILATEARDIALTQLHDGHAHISIRNRTTGEITVVDANEKDILELYRERNATIKNLAQRLFRVKHSEPLLSVGFLCRHDRNGGHTLKLHVGKDTSSLIQRHKERAKNGAVPLPWTSTFSSVYIAEDAVSKVIIFNQVMIQRWLTNPKSFHLLPLIVDLGYVVGICLKNGENEPRSTTKVTVRLLKRPALEDGYLIVSAFPSL